MIRNEVGVVLGVHTMLHSAVCVRPWHFFLHFSHLKKGISLLLDKKAKEW